MRGRKRKRQAVDALLSSGDATSCNSGVVHQRKGEKGGGRRKKRERSFPSAALHSNYAVDALAQPARGLEREGEERREGEKGSLARDMTDSDSIKASIPGWASPNGGEDGKRGVERKKKTMAYSNCHCMTHSVRGSQFEA